MPRRLRLSGVWTPTVILTGFWSDESMLEAAGLGAVRYLRKPVVPCGFAAVRRATSLVDWKVRSPSFALSRNERKPADSALRMPSRRQAPSLGAFHRHLAAADVTIFEFMVTARSLRRPSNLPRVLHRNGCRLFGRGSKKGIGAADESISGSPKS
jgi:hypothetical protein